MSEVERLRHTGAHILAQAVKRLFHSVRLAIGPPIENGFYYDFEVEHPFSEEDLKKIEEEMRKIVEADYPVEQVYLDRAEAEKILQNEPFKQELLKEIPDEKVSFYRDGEFIDLCRGPHVSRTGEVKFFKILGTAGAYWRGDERRPMLQRIYGTAFFTQEELEQYLRLQEEAAKRDHRKLGKELELFTFFPDEAGAGLVFYLPRGVVFRRILEEINIQEHLKRGYIQVMTPHLMKIHLWETSGHLENYRDNMFIIQEPRASESEGVAEQYAVKPMNCPAHILLYKSKRRSYRELPMRIYELGTVYRFERGGTMHGLMRVRGFTQDDAHIFCSLSDLEKEIQGVLEFTFYLLKIFGFRWELALKGRPQLSMGEEFIWEHSEKALRNALESLHLLYDYYPRDGAFYGPKIDIILKDALGRDWQGPTVQVDFNLPQRFQLIFVNAEDREEQPVIIHRACWGSLERFIGILIEHYGGRFPLWLSPVQIRVLPIADRHQAYANQVALHLQKKGLRVETDNRNQTLPYKIREGQKEKIPYLLVIGNREMEQNTVSVRSREEGDMGSMSLEQFYTSIQKNLSYKEEESGA